MDINGHNLFAVTRRFGAFFYVTFSDFSIVVLDYMFNVSSATMAYIDAVSVDDFV